MMRVVAVVNQKGGVGKTTAAVNFGHALARTGQRILLIDLDPQAHLGASLGYFKPVHDGAAQVLLHNRPVADRLLALRDWCTLLPGGDELVEVERQSGGSERGLQLRDALDSASLDIDTVVIDCPPSSGLLIVNAIAAAHDVLVPVAGDYLSLTGLARLMLTIKRLSPMTRPELRKWIFMSRFVARRRLSREVVTKVREHFPASLLDASISEAAALAESAGAGKSIFEYRKRSKSAGEFDALADGFLHEKVFADGQENASHVA